MADKGAVGNLQIYGVTKRIHVFGVFAGRDAKSPLAQNGSITGTVQENGVAVKGALITLHWRSSMACIGRTWSAADGSFSFTNLDPGLSGYVIICQDPDGGTQYNDIIYSLLTPL